jgi:hypothetical protein
MPRALTLQRTVIPRGDRERFLERVKRKREHYTRANCRFWVFEEEGLPGAFLEFYEASDSETLARAHASSPYPVRDAFRVYIESESV